MSYTIRNHRPGDMGMVIHRHGVLYYEEYNWDERFEALVAEICAHFIQNLDPARERCWIAEVNGKFAGSIFLVRKDETTAKLRLLIVEPSARGLGIGKELTRQCLDFARACGYKKVVLWTQSTLFAARHIYERAGFRKVAEEPYQNFGHDHLSETWELDLV
jgi:ribosomal protein S18 acetylase RimI-like enzyme